MKKNEDKVHDFRKDPITLVFEGDYIKADGTTLGADNGIGMAAQLALLDSKDIPHCPLECLFTIDEETGLTGAFALDGNMLKAKRMVNLDNEEDYMICIGCAGGVDSNIEFPAEFIDTPKDYKSIELFFTGAKGGHSGMNIPDGLANSLKLTNRLLNELNKNFDIYINSFTGGTKRNAIPREARTYILVKENQKKEVLDRIQSYIKIIQDEYKGVEDNLNITINENPNKTFDKALSKESASKLISFIITLPHGVYRMSPIIEDLVETSSNLAIIEIENGNAKILMNQRSSRASNLDEAVSVINNLSKLVGAKSEQNGAYPGWQPNPDSEMVKKIETIYHQLFKEKPITAAVHAGLECGIINEKVPGMDSVAIGPNIYDPHSPQEKVSISSVDKFWKLLTEIIKLR